MLSVVIPVYRNEASIPSLIAALNELAVKVEARHGKALEVVFVVDGSPDNSFCELEQRLPNAGFASRLVLHSRNFGSMAAVRTGLGAATGEYFGVMAADLQEPPELMLDFFEGLASGEFDVMIGCRNSRQDPFASRLASGIFWRLYRALVIPEMPRKGVDAFGCNSTFRDHLLRLDEAHSSMIGLIFWLGFRRGEAYYERRARAHGRSAWTLKKKINYLLDSVFSFTDLPIRFLTLFGAFGVVLAVLLGAAIVFARMTAGIAVPGYAATMVAVIFFGGINAMGLGIVGSYAWRTYENTKRRPLSLTLVERAFPGRSEPLGLEAIRGSRVGEDVGAR